MPLREGEGRLSFVKGQTYIPKQFFTSTPALEKAQSISESTAHHRRRPRRWSICSSASLKLKAFTSTPPTTTIRIEAGARRRSTRLVILDVMLPGGSGFELLKALRHDSAVPVLLLTARGEAVDRILGLEIGADDYLAKPFDPRELVARIRAVLRRTREAAFLARRAAKSTKSCTVGDIEISLATRNVTCGGKPVDLTSVEFNVLELLLRNAGNVVTREQIAEVALGPSVERLRPQRRCPRQPIAQEAGGLPRHRRPDTSHSRRRILPCRLQPPERAKV